MGEGNSHTATELWAEKAIFGDVLILIMKVQNALVSSSNCCTVVIYQVVKIGINFTQGGLFFSIDRR